MKLFSTGDGSARTSMEGMIWNANNVLGYALEPKVNGIPRTFFEVASGLVIISIVEMGFIVSGNVGTGIVMKNLGRGKWSPPSACGMTGLGWGFLVGASMKELMIFIMDDETMDAIVKETGLKLGTQSEMTLGPLGRTYQFDVNASKGGFGSTVAIAFSKGAFLGLSVAGAVLGSRPKVNEAFYGRPITTDEILSSPHNIIPTHKVTMLDEVYEKLHKIEEGLILEAQAIIAEEKQKKAAEQAEKAEQEMLKHETVEKVEA